MQRQRGEFRGLRERMAYLEGLRESITGGAAASRRQREPSKTSGRVACGS